MIGDRCHCPPGSARLGKGQRVEKEAEQGAGWAVGTGEEKEGPCVAVLFTGILISAGSTSSKSTIRRGGGGEGGGRHGTRQRKSPSRGGLEALLRMDGDSEIMGVSSNKKSRRSTTGS